MLQADIDQGDLGRSPGRKVHNRLERIGKDDRVALKLESTALDFVSEIA